MLGLIGNAEDRNKPYRWSVRNTVQTIVLTITVLIGIQFYFWTTQIRAGGEVTISRPPGVEGFLPIGSLMGWKYWLQTGIWDAVHPAGMVILGFAILLSLVLRKAFCGWFCPIGTLSEWLWKLGRKKSGDSWLPPKWLDIGLRSVKYLLLFFFGWAVASMSAADIAGFLELPYWKVADIKMLNFFTAMSLTTAVVLLVLTIGSLFIRNFWCRYFCPYGALTGIFALFSPSRIQRDDKTCTACGVCARVCPAYLPVDKKDRIVSAECTGCYSCVEVCPVKPAMEMKTLGLKSRFWTARRLAWAVGGGFILVVITARVLGLWTSSVTIGEIRAILPRIDFLQHF